MFNDIKILFTQNPVLFDTIAVYMGLITGSFLNVVIYRLPIMIKRKLAMRTVNSGVYPSEKELRYLSQEFPKKFNLAVPRSACPCCAHQITALENIPVLSYLMLGGRCSNCKEPISSRYPKIEILSAVVTGCSALFFGFTWFTLYISLSYLTIIALVMMVYDEYKQKSPYMAEDYVRTEVEFDKINIPEVDDVKVSGPVVFEGVSVQPKKQTKKRKPRVKPAIA